MLNIKKILCAAVMAATFTSTVSAQTSTEELKKEINKIKKSSSYIYAEATLADQQSAIDLAKDILNQNINEWVAKQKKFAGSNKVVTVNTNYAVEDMTLPRGNMYRAFMYVKKSDIIPVANVTVTETPEEVKNSNQAGTSTVVPLDEVTTQLLAMENTGQLSALLKQLKQDGKVTDYNKLSNLQSPENYIMVVFNREGNIEAVLGEGTNRKNLKTGADDALTNYKGRGAIGVKLAK
ncbi:MAG: hypothetical protein ACI4TW_08850 [Prevotella sp.]